MLRVAVLFLLLLNGAYFGWSQGYLQAYGLGPSARNEPQRLAQQIRPELLRVLGPEEGQRVESQQAAVSASA